MFCPSLWVIQLLTVITPLLCLQKRLAESVFLVSIGASLWITALLTTDLINPNPDNNTLVILAQVQMFSIVVAFCCHVSTLENIFITFTFILCSMLASWCGYAL